MAQDRQLDQISYRDLRTNKEKVAEYLSELIEIFTENVFVSWMIEELAKEGGTPQEAYPSQGLFFTGREGYGPDEPERVIISDELRDRTIEAWLYYLFLNNHKERLDYLYQISNEPFVAPKGKRNRLFSQARKDRRAITIGDLALEPGGSNRKRRSRNELHADGPFVPSFHPSGCWSMLKDYFRKEKKSSGRKQARGIFAIGANPEITGSPMALATIAMSHSLVCIPRDGFFSDTDRQVNLAEKAIKWIDKSPIFYDKNEEETEMLRDFYIHNLVGVVEPNPEKAEDRARKLYQAGVRTFRIYSPEPGNDILLTLKRLRQIEKQEGWEPIEIFAGQVVDVKQAIDLENAGADGIYLGIGGGGRCTTGVVAGLTINWIQLVWDLRGKINIPIIAEGGANDNIGPSLASGVSHIGVVGKLAGTIETPGGFTFYREEKGNLFVFYGGEASDRMRAMANRFGPLDIIQNREGESTKKFLQVDENTVPTIFHILDFLNQGVVGSLVFQNVDSIAEMQDQGADRLMLGAINDQQSRNTH